MILRRKQQSYWPGKRKRSFYWETYLDHSVKLHCGKRVLRSAVCSGSSTAERTVVNRLKKVRFLPGALAGIPAQQDASSKLRFDGLCWLGTGKPGIRGFDSLRTCASCEKIPTATSSREAKPYRRDRGNTGNFCLASKGIRFERMKEAQPSIGVDMVSCRYKGANSNHAIDY